MESHDGNYAICFPFLHACIRLQATQVRWIGLVGLIIIWLDVLIFLVLQGGIGGLVPALTPPVCHRATDDHRHAALWHHDHAGVRLSTLTRLLPLREVSGR